MTAVALKPPPLSAASEAARVLGKRGGRPRGSCSSPLSIWLRAEVKRRQREGWGRREAFDIVANAERPVGRDTFELSEWTADSEGIETIDRAGNDRPARVSWAYWKKIWLEVPN